MRFNDGMCVPFGKGPNEWFFSLDFCDCGRKQLLRLELFLLPADQSANIYFFLSQAKLCKLD